MNTAIIRYQGGNIQSVAFALERLGVNFSITDDPEVIQRADNVIFPGVGEASSTMRYLKEKNLDKLICNLRQPILGICLGMQLMCRHSEENDTPCLGIFDVEVKRLPGKPLKVPHMGWNMLHNTNNWIDRRLEGKFVYFVHSFFVPLNIYTVAQVTYDQPFSAAMRKDNFFAVQFHPEKSAEQGVPILQGFLQQSLAS